MSIEFRCEACGKLLRTGDDTAGKQAKCPDCGSLQTIPSAGSVPTSANPFGAPDPIQSAATETSEVNPYRAPLGHDEPAPVIATAGGPLVAARMDIGDVLGTGWRIYQSQLGNCILVVIVAIILNYAVSFAGNLLSQAVALGGQAGGLDEGIVIAMIVGMQFVIGVGGFFAQTWLQLGQVICLLKIARGQAFSMGDLFKGGPYLLRSVGTTILIALLLLAILLPCALPAGALYLATQDQDVAGIAGAVGMVVWVIATAVISLMISQYMNLLVDRNLGAVDSLRSSRTIMAGNKLSLFALGIVLALINLAGALACCVGLIFTMPYLMLTVTVAYLRMTSQPVAAT